MLPVNDAQTTDDSQATTDSSDEDVEKVVFSACFPGNLISIQCQIEYQAHSADDVESKFQRQSGSSHKK